MSIFSKIGQFFTKILSAAGCLYELTRGVIAFFIIVFLVHFFLATLFIVSGSSMEPNFLESQLIVVEKITHLKAPPKRGEVVGLRFPGDPERRKYIKRIVALPGEKIEIKDGQVKINGNLLLESYLPADLKTEGSVNLALDPDEYYILGDNRPVSNDSRYFGPISQKYIIGRAYFIIWPFKYTSFVPQPVF